MPPRFTMISSSSNIGPSQVHEKLYTQPRTSLGGKRTQTLHVDTVHLPRNKKNTYPPTSTSLDIQGQPDWEYFCSIFPHKQSILFEYQTLSLFKEPTPAKKWSQHED